MQRTFEASIDVLMELHRLEPSKGHHRAALEMAERSRARSLLESLGELRPKVAERMDGGLLSRERELNKRLENAAAALEQAVARKAPELDAAVARTTLEGLLADTERLRVEIRRSNPAYARLSETEPVSVAVLQRDLLDSDTALLEIALGDNRSFAWLLTLHDLQAFELPARNVIEPLARDIQTHVSARNGRPLGETPQNRRRRLDRADKSLTSALSSLSALLKPVLERVTERRLLIAASGALLSVPFASLPSPVSGRPLATTQELVLLPSASVETLLTRRSVVERADGPTVLVVADPVFDSQDGRVASSLSRSANGRVTVGSDLVRAAGDVGVLEAGRLPRLPSTRDEATAIAALVPASKRRVLLDFEANVAALTAAPVSARILHLATHALINTAHPELSGIAMSAVDREGNTRDGFLRLHQILNLDVSADLVVLSACETALGKQVAGEGIMGLTSGFIQAGARGVISSLWQVGDQATAELMRFFYAELLGPRKSPAGSALRAAQARMAAHPRFSHPYYWSGFVLQGDWRMRIE